MTSAGEVRIRPVIGLPEIGAGDPLGELIAERAGELVDGDVVVVSQKVVSKAEGRTRKLSSVIPGAEARKYAAVLGKEPALVELILEESAEVVRAERGVLIVETVHGLVCANAGIDSSNVGDDEYRSAAVQPFDGDAVAWLCRAQNLEMRVTVTLNDTVADRSGSDACRIVHRAECEIAAARTLQHE